MTSKVEASVNEALGDLDRQLKALAAMRAALAGIMGSAPKGKKRAPRTGGRKLSAAGKARIAAAARKRWAAYRKAKAARKATSKRVTRKARRA